MQESNVGIQYKGEYCRASKARVDSKTSFDVFSNETSNDEIKRIRPVSEPRKPYQVL